MSASFSHDLEAYLSDGWSIASTAATSSSSETDDEQNGRTFLITVQKGSSVRVLGYEHFVKIDEDEDLDPTPYKASFVKNLAG